MCSLQDVLKIVHILRPAGSIQWAEVAARYATVRKAKYPTRDAEQIKRYTLNYEADIVLCSEAYCGRRYKALLKNSKPTGDRQCPKDVRYAKRIQKAIENDWQGVELGHL